jgi:hypothetical protein
VGYRRPKAAAREAVQWRDFVDADRDLFAKAGVPGSLATDQRLFDYFLMRLSR